MRTVSDLPLVEDLRMVNLATPGKHLLALLIPLALVHISLPLDMLHLVVKSRKVSMLAEWTRCIRLAMDKVAIQATHTRLMAQVVNRCRRSPMLYPYN